MLPFYPLNEFGTLYNIKIQQVNLIFLCNYFGQIDPNTGKPEGIGMAVAQDGRIFEGGFKDGERSPLCVHTWPNG